jgi:hypothetical protein
VWYFRIELSNEESETDGSSGPFESPSNPYPEPKRQ